MNYQSPAQPPVPPSGMSTPVGGGPSGEAPGPARRDEAGFNLAVLLKLFQRRLWWFLGAVLVLSFLSVLAIASMQPIYSADAVVLIEARQPSIADVDDRFPSFMSDSEAVKSEVQILKSREMALKAVDKLGLTKHPLFTQPSRRETLCGHAASLVGPGTLAGGLDLIGLSGLCSVVRADEKALRAAVAFWITESLQAFQVDDSRAIWLHLEAPDPKLAADVVNTVADLYLVDKLDAKFDATERANTWLAERVEGLRAEVEAAERAVETYRAQAGLVEGERATTLVRQQISDVTTSLATAQATLADAQAKLRQVDQAVDQGGDPGAVFYAFGSPVLVELAKAEAELRRRAADLSRSLGERHPTMAKLRAELADAASQVRQEIARLREGLRNEAAVAQARVDNLKATLRDLEQRAETTGQSEVRLRALEREAEARRNLLQVFLGKTQQMVGREGITTAEARIITRAEVPNEPSKPNRPLLFTGSLILAVACGVALVLLVEHLDAGFRAVEEVEDETLLPVLSVVPALKNLPAKPERVANYILENPRTQLNDALNGLRSGLWLNSRGEARSVLFTSALPNEGKSTLCAWFSRLCAHGGERVIVVDCDFLNPNVHTYFGSRNGAGVAEVLAGKCELFEAIRTDGDAGPHYLTAGRATRRASAMLRSAEFDDLMRALSQRYDLVVIDSAPVLAVSDTKVLAVAADKTVFVCRWRSTPRASAVRAVQELRQAGAALAGVILSGVDYSKFDLYSHYHPKSYKRVLKKYYAG